MVASVDLLPAGLKLTGSAGSPFALTVTATPTDEEGDPISWATFTDIEVAVYDSASIAVDDYAPTVTSPSEGVISVVWTAEQTTLMRGLLWPWQLWATIDGDGPYGLAAGGLRIKPEGTPGASTDAAVDLTVEVGTASVALTVTVGGTGNGSGGIDGGSFSSEYGGTTGIDGGEF